MANDKTAQGEREERRRWREDWRAWFDADRKMLYDFSAVELYRFYANACYRARQSSAAEIEKLNHELADVRAMHRDALQDGEGMVSRIDGLRAEIERLRGELIKRGPETDKVSRELANKINKRLKQAEAQRDELRDENKEIRKTLTLFQLRAAETTDELKAQRDRARLNVKRVIGRIEGNMFGVKHKTATLKLLRAALPDADEGVG